MRMLDLFCGRWGWSRAFAARGWECVGIDVMVPLEIPDGCIFIQRDVMELDAGFLRDFAFVCASSPCQQFTVWTMRNFHPDPAYPADGIRLFEHTRSICEESGVPYVIENVRSAEQFVGDAVHHCGPFYLWGNAVPPLMPQNINKGFGKMDRKFIIAIGSSKSVKRTEHRARVATIPPELANCVCDYAERILEQ